MSRYVVIAASVACAASALAQGVPVVRIPDGVTCAACRITLTPAVTLGEDDGPGMFTYPSSAVRVDGRGRYWVLHGNDDTGGPPIFDANGRFLRVAGRAGSGPGEFQHVNDALPLPGDSVLIMDNNRRGTVLGPDLIPRRYIQLPAPLSRSLVLDWPREVLGYSTYAAGLRGGPTLHVMSFEGPAAQVTHSFGPEWSMADMRTTETTMSKPVASRTGFWSSWDWKYRMDHWRVAGGLERTIERPNTWFVGEHMGLIGSREKPPSAHLTGMLEDNAGRLWTFVSVAAPTWREAWPRSTGEMRIAEFGLDRLRRSIIEVIDPVANRVVARREVNEWICAVLPDMRAAIHTVDASGVPRLTIVRLSLAGS